MDAQKRRIKRGERRQMEKDFSPFVLAELMN
jgi:hypothetical protein